MRKKIQSGFTPRQYMLSRDYEIYYYSDLHFRTVERHSHGYYEFYFFVEGAMEMELGDARCPLRTGDVVVVPPGVPHRACVVDGAVPYRRFVFWIGRDYCASLAAQSPDYDWLLRQITETGRYVYHFDTIEFNILCGKLSALLEELHAERFGRESRIQLSIRDLLLHLNRAVYEQERRPSKQERRNIYESLTAFIEGHLDEELTLDRLAEQFYVSKYYIAHLFQDNTGLSVHRYITKKRLDACGGAIRSGAGIVGTFKQYGFRDYSAFYRAFKKEYGMSPAEYRELHLHDNAGHS